MPSDPKPPVGYRKPPQHSRYRAGQSGNPQGRPRGSKNLATLVHQALEEKVVVTEDGRRRKISKRQAIVAQLVNRSAQADLKATQILLGLMQEIERRNEAQSTDTNGFAAEDDQVMQLLAARLAPGKKENPDA